jgi:hypothetical protein
MTTLRIRKLFPLTLVLLAFGASACAGEDDVGRDVAFNTAHKGAKLLAQDGLVITARMFDGSQESTKNKRFTRVTLVRGETDKGYWCDSHTRLGAEQHGRVRIRCGTYVETVSNDDDEAFSFDLIGEGDGAGSLSFRLDNISYTGDGTFLADHVEHLVGEVDDWSGISWDLEDTTIALSADKRGDAKTDPFTLASEVSATLGSFIGGKVYYDDVEDKLTVRALSFDIAHDMTVGVYATLSKSGSIGVSTPQRVSLLSNAGELASGYASATTLLGRIDTAFNGAPPPDDLSEAIALAISPLDGPNTALAKAIEVTDVPTDELWEALSDAGQSIEERSFEGTDYEASVYGYYAIYLSPGDDEPVAYVVWGGGSGEPDYHDGVVIGFDVDANQVHYEVVDG